MCRLLTLLCAVLLLSAPLEAQPKVTLEIRASIPTEGGRRVPVIGRFWLVSRHDSLAIVTDGHGVGRTEALAGSYRVRSWQRVGIGALAYYWDVPVRLTRGTAVDLTERNARSTPPTAVPDAAVMEGADSTPVPELPVHTPASVQATLAAAPLPYRQPGDPGYRDPELARILGLLPGAGHLYAGETAKGIGLLTVGALGGTLLVNQLGCGGDDPCDTPMLAFGAVSFAAAAMYSIVDAAPAARRANLLAPEFSLVPLPGGRFGAGLRLSLP